MAVGIVGRVQNHPFISGLGIRFVEPPRRRRRIDANVRVMHGAAARTEFHAAHVAPAGARHGDHEVAKQIGAAGAQRVLGQRHHEIGRAHLPPGAPARRGREIRPFALETVTGRPAGDRLDLGVRQPAFAGENANSRFRFPRRHVPPRRDGRDLRGMPAHLVVRDQAERRRAVRLVASRARLVEDRRDVLREGDRSSNRQRGSGSGRGRGADGLDGQQQPAERDEKPLHHLGYGRHASRNRRSIAPQTLDVRLLSAYFRRLLPFSYSRHTVLLS